MEFVCSVCNYRSDTKKHVERHINNKKPCGEGIRVIENVLCEIKCKHCDKNFASKPNLKRHVETCKVKKINIEEEYKVLKEKLALAEEALAVKPVSTTIHNTTNNIIIQLNSWRDPEYPEDMDRYYREAIKKVFMSVPNLIQNIHFNPDMPENQNICIKNYRTKVAKVYDGTKWITIDEDKLLNSLINTYECELENWADDKPGRLKYIEEYKEIKKRDGRLKVEKDLRETVKKVIYDNSNMIKVIKTS